MNRIEITDAIEKAITDRPVSITGKWYLSWKKDKIVCTPAGAYPGPEKIFCTVNQDEAEYGFTSKQWNKIIFDIVTFLEKTRRCPKPPKP